MRRSDRELKTTEEIIDVLKSGTVIQIAFIDNGEPYIVTLNYGYVVDGEAIKLYFHSATAGRKIECIKHNPNVCFSIAICDPLIKGENACGYGMKYRSVVGYGEIRIVENSEEKISALNLLMKQYTGKDSWEYDNKMLEITTVSCLDVERITGKRKN